MKLIKKIKSTIKSNNKNNVDSNQKIYYRAPVKTGNENGECDPVSCLLCVLTLGVGFLIYDNYLKD